ncbi:MAG: DNA polymerase III subunit delta [Desulfovibrionaceae bacterium]|nr:DNA polymerase III subunit delta [Desulfovibrionaceae bacterium]MBF0514881.1 DNA polymerase III subunit delta [Desulfovibrionaceae bacterium]
MSRPGFSFLVCPDAEMVREKADSLLAGVSPVFGRRVYWGDEELAPGFWEDLTVQSLMAEPKAVVLRRAHACPGEFWGKLAGPLRGFNSLIWPIFCLEGSLERKKSAVPKELAAAPFWKVAKQKGWVWESEGLTPETLRACLIDWAGGRGLSFAPRVLDELSAALPMDFALTRRELEKLELAVAPGSQVTREHLSLVGSHAAMDPFAFLRSFANPKAAFEVWRKIIDDQLLTGDGAIFPFLGLLASDARQMWNLVYGDPDSVRLSPYVAKNKAELARRLGSKGLERIWELCFEAETGIKTGRRDPDQAMEILAAGLFALFGRRA